jgi:hypothetical protein
MIKRNQYRFSIKYLVKIDDLWGKSEKFLGVLTKIYCLKIKFRSKLIFWKVFDQNSVFMQKKTQKIFEIFIFVSLFTYIQPHNLHNVRAIFFYINGTPRKDTFELGKDRSKFLHHAYCNYQPKTFSLPPLLLVEIFKISI